MENIDPLTHIKKSLLGFQQHLKKRDEAIESRFAELTRQSEEAFEKFASMSEKRFSQLEEHLFKGSPPKGQDNYLKVVDSSGKIHYIPRSDGDYISLTLVPNAIQEANDHSRLNAEEEYALKAIKSILAGTNPYSIIVKFYLFPYGTLEINCTQGEMYAASTYDKDAEKRNSEKAKELLEKLSFALKSQSIGALTPEIFGRSDIPLQVHFRPSLIG